MVTISISEQENEIVSLIKQSMQKKGLRIGSSKSRSQADYLFLPPSSQKSCDVLLLHDQIDFPCQADYMTILNADKTWPDVPVGSSLLVTYGLNPLSTLTASSFHTEPDNPRFLCCLQRSIVTLKGKVIEPQEFPVVLPEPLPEITSAMAFVTLALILSFPPEDFKHFPPIP